MKRIRHYKYILWILLSIGLFAFLLPAETDFLEKIIAGYVFYLFMKEIFQTHLKHLQDKSIEVDDRLEVLNDRIENVPHKTSVYIHNNHEEEVEQEKDNREYM